MFEVVGAGGSISLAPHAPSPPQLEADSDPIGHTFGSEKVAQSEPLVQTILPRFIRVLVCTKDSFSVPIATRSGRSWTHNRAQFMPRLCSLF